MYKILYCKKCLLENKDLLHTARDYSASFIHPQEHEYYRGIVGGDPAINICPECNTKLLDTGLDIKEFDQIIEYGNFNPEFLIAMIELKKSDIIEYTNKMQPVIAKFEEKMEKCHNECEQKRKAEQEFNNQVHCPRCGSTQITTGQTFKRALFGLLYNQVTVNRCANCGCTWEPGK